MPPDWVCARRLEGARPVDDATAEAFIAEDPAVFGRLVRMGTPIGVEVVLPAVDPTRMAALVTASWRHRAPRRLLKELDAGG